MNESLLLAGECVWHWLMLAAREIALTAGVMTDGRAECLRGRWMLLARRNRL